MRFEYYDYDEFQKILRSLSTADAAKLLSKISKIEQNGLMASIHSQQVKPLDP